MIAEQLAEQSRVVAMHLGAAKASGSRHEVLWSLRNARFGIVEQLRIIDGAAEAANQSIDDLLVKGLVDEYLRGEVEAAGPAGAGR